MVCQNRAVRISDGEGNKLSTIYIALTDAEGANSVTA